MKYLIIILICFSSCKHSELLPTPEAQRPIPEYIEQPNQAQIIIMPPVKSEKVMTEESFRLLVDKITTLISTTLAIMFVDQAQ